MASAAAGGAPGRLGSRPGAAAAVGSGGRACHATRPAGLEGYLDLGHLAEVRLYRPFGPDPLGREDAQGP